MTARRAGCALLGLLAACTHDPRCDHATELDPEAFPEASWPRACPEDVALDSDQLDVAASYAESIGSHCLLVVRSGRLVFERYFGATTPDAHLASWSIAKSFAATVIGIAVSRGEIASVEDPVARYVPQWDVDTYRAITIRDLLGHVSGLAYDWVDDNLGLLGEDDMTAAALARPVAAPPGSVFAYSNAGVQVLEAVIEGATGRAVEDYAREHLWSRLGMDPGTSWDRDAAGNVTTFKGVRASCEDLARFGYLYLHGGAWSGEPIVTTDFVGAALSPSQSINPAYGYLFWLNGRGPAISAQGEPFDGSLLPGAPADLVAALGLGQNFVDVVASTGTVYVHLRPAPFENPTVSDVVDALEHDGLLREHRVLLDELLRAER